MTWALVIGGICGLVNALTWAYAARRLALFWCLRRDPEWARRQFTSGDRDAAARLVSSTRVPAHLNARVEQVALLTRRATPRPGVVWLMAEMTPDGVRTTTGWAWTQARANRRAASTPPVLEPAPQPGPGRTPQ